METTTEVYASKTIETIYERRAVRKFMDKPIDKKIILNLLEAARMAPSAMNRQPWHFYVLSDKKKIETFSKAILDNSKFAMLKAGIKEAAHYILHPGSFNLKGGVDFFSAADPIFHGAPVVIFISSDKASKWAPVDVGMCAQNIMLAAKSIGLDTCPVGLAKYIENTDEYNELGVPDSEQINLAIIVGYGAEKPEVHERKKDNAKFIG